MRASPPHPTLRQSYVDSYLQCAYVLSAACATPGGATVADVADALRAVALLFPGPDAARSAWTVAASELPNGGLAPPRLDAPAATPEALLRVVDRLHRLLYAALPRGVVSKPFAGGHAEAARVFDAATWYADQTKWGGLVWFVLLHLALHADLSRLWPSVSPSRSPVGCCAALVSVMAAALPCSVCREHAKQTVPDALESLAARGVLEPFEWTWRLRELVRETRARRDPPEGAWPPTSAGVRRLLSEAPVVPPTGMGH